MNAPGCGFPDATDEELEQFLEDGKHFIFLSAKDVERLLKHKDRGPLLPDNYFQDAYLIGQTMLVVWPKYGNRGMLIPYGYGFGAPNNPTDDFWNQRASAIAKIPIVGPEPLDQGDGEPQ